MKYIMYLTRWGNGAIVYEKTRPVRVFLPSHDELSLGQEICDVFGHLEYDESESVAIKYRSFLEAYFSGERIEFVEKLDIKDVSSFESAVYINLQAIPYGEIITYKELAELCGHPGAARAVGNAMQKNPLPVIVPCHRVIKSDGSIGGWSGRAGWKERLLDLERSDKWTIYKEINKDIIRANDYHSI